MATMHVVPAKAPEEASARVEEVRAAPSDARLVLEQNAPSPRGERVGLDTPVGRVEVLLLWSEAQHQLGLLEEPLDRAVPGFAPAGVFSRKERPTGRMVLSLPVLRF
ncbi:MAG TPA: hypothetical protein VKY51_04270 [Fredinandcohnia sp.]|nr:hypothetical protein [Fredinandcohnia sp.]